MKKRLLIVDDEPVIREIVRDCLGSEFFVLEAGDATEGSRILHEEVPDLLIVDVRMPGGGGLPLVKDGLASFPDLAVLVITGHGSVETFMEFFRLGVADYVLKPFTPAEIRRAAVRALETRRLRAENARLRASIERVAPADRFTGSSKAAREVRVRLSQVAAAESTVLITGASGTGKEVAARAIHDLSGRAKGPFVAVHCGALPEALVESELFGHARGAFTGADRARPGRFEDAEGGTIFLDEIGTMTMEAQVRLLRVLQEREVTRVGDDVPHRVNVRVIAATNANLEATVASGTFRKDLFYRLDVLRVQLPRLADRKEDVPDLARHFARQGCTRFARPEIAVSQAGMRRLIAHDWPGNARELENVIHQAIILAKGQDAVELEHLLIASPELLAPSDCDLPEAGLDLPVYLENIEHDLIEQALARTGHVQQAAANLLGIQRTTLAQKLRRRQARGAEADS